MTKRYKCISSGRYIHCRQHFTEVPDGFGYSP